MEKPSGTAKSKALLRKCAIAAGLFLLLLFTADNMRPPSGQFTANAAAAAITVYQEYISRGVLQKNGITICRFTPTCSEYTKQALLKYGFIKGSAMGVCRVIRCNPWSSGGEDLP